jgi:hypothetical protein
MRSEIKPGQTVIVAALPVPLNALEELTKLVERIYGTGDTMLNMSEGDSIRIMAPKDGFGPVKRSRSKLTPRDPELDETLLRSVKVQGETASMTLESAADQILHITESFMTWFDVYKGINYVTTEFVVAGQTGAPYYLTIQKGGNPSAHDLRLRAEDKHIDLLAKIERTDDIATVIERVRSGVLDGTIANPEGDSTSELIAKAIAEHLNPSTEER